MSNIQEWLEKIPDETERRSALLYHQFNQEKYKGKTYNPYNYTVSSLPEALELGFPWHDTNQGIDYWTEVSNKYRTEEYGWDYDPDDDDDYEDRYDENDEEY